MSAQADPDPAARPRLHLHDLGALVVGYGLAALLGRVLWPASRRPEPPEAVLFALAYLWLGLAMSGPVLLLRGGRGREPASPAGGPRHSRAELCWVLIGGYWIGLALLVLPSRKPVDALLGLLPIVAAIVLQLFGPRRRSAPAERPGWSHRVALGLLWTWPLAWLAMILLGQAL